MTREQVIAAVKRDASAATDPVLSDPDVEGVVDAAVRATVWAAGTAYTVGARVVPTVRTGYHFRCVRGGTSGATAPAWPGIASDALLLARPITLGMRLGDGTVIWELAGEDWDTLWDARAATYAAWRLKAARASSYAAARFDSETFNEQQIYEHCEQQAARWAPIGVA